MAILPIDAAIQANLRETTTRVLASLTPREERVLRMRFGIGMNTDHTLEEVGQQFSVTRERIRQIEAKALRKLKHPSRSRKLQELPGQLTASPANSRIAKGAFGRPFLLLARPSGLSLQPSRILPGRIISARDAFSAAADPDAPPLALNAALPETTGGRPIAGGLDDSLTVLLINWTEQGSRDVRNSPKRLDMPAKKQLRRDGRDVQGVLPDDGRMRHGGGGRKRPTTRFSPVALMLARRRAANVKTSRDAQGLSGAGLSRDHRLALSSRGAIAGAVEHCR